MLASRAGVLAYSARALRHQVSLAMTDVTGDEVKRVDLFAVSSIHWGHCAVPVVRGVQKA